MLRKRPTRKDVFLVFLLFFFLSLISLHRTTSLITEKKEPPQERPPPPGAIPPLGEKPIEPDCNPLITRYPETPSHLLHAVSKPSPSLLNVGAREVVPNDLIRGVHDSLLISHHHRIIHQTWKTRNASEYPFDSVWHSSDHWKAKHPGWLYVLWSDQDNEELVRVKFPQYLETYQSFSHNILRADFIRNLYLHAFGGVYADMDVLPLSNLADHLPIFSSNISSSVPVAYVGEMLYAWDLGIPNAWMASTPRHPFWLTVAQRAVDKMQDPNVNQKDIERLTGPQPLYLSTHEWNEEWERRHRKGYFGEVVILKHPRIFPFSWADKDPASHCLCSPTKSTFDPNRCIGVHQDAWTITFWGSSWMAWTEGWGI